MSGEVTIRRATAPDADAIVDVHARSWRATYRGLLPDRLIADVVARREERVRWIRAGLTDPASARRVWVAARGSRIVGMAIWEPSRDDDGQGVAELAAIYLDPDAFGQGIGRKMMAEIQADMTDAGFRVATLWVLESNERARGFYEACGWATDGARKVEERPAGALHEVRYRRGLRLAPSG